MQTTGITEPAILGHDLQPTPEVEVGKLLSLMGNTEKKCFIELMIEPGEIVENSDLNSRFASMQQSAGRIKYKAHNNLASSITNSHAQAGIFEVDANGQWVAVKSEDAELADSVAGHNLNISSHTDLALIEIFGKTSTPDEARSPENRLIIYNELLKVDPDKSLSLVELAKATGIDKKIIFKHVKNLEKIGVINYFGIPVTEVNPEFRINSIAYPETGSITPDGHIRKYAGTYRDDLTLPTKITQYINNALESGRATFSYEDLIGLVEGPSDHYKKTRLVMVMAKLIKDGSVSPLHPNSSQEDDFSIISLSPEHRPLIEEVAETYKRLSAGDKEFIKEGIRVGKVIINDPVLLTKLLTKGWDKEPGTKRIDFNDAAGVILNIVDGQEAGVATADILSGIVDAFDTNITPAGLYSILKKLKASNRIGYTKTGTRAIWHKGDNL